MQVRPTFFYYLVYEIFSKKIGSGGRNKNKNKSNNMPESTEIIKIKQFTEHVFFIFYTGEKELFSLYTNHVESIYTH